MAENYYTEPNRNIPNVFESHVGTIIDHVAATLFTSEFLIDRNKAYNRILLSDTNSGNTINLGDAYQFFKGMNDHYPFVAYNIGNVSIPSDYGISQSHTIGVQYLEELNAYVKTYPMDFEIQFIAFFNDSLDNRKAMALMQSQAFSLNRLYSKVMFDDVEVKLPITLKIQIDKGELQYELEQYLIQNRIWNFNFTYTGRYYEYLFQDINTPDTTDKTIYDVLDIYGNNIGINKKVQVVDTIELNTLRSDTKSNLDTVNSPEINSILSVFPNDNSTNVNRTSIISITFSKSIVPESFVNSFTIFPDIDYDIYYSNDYKIANIKPFNDTGFAANKTYECTIGTNVLDVDFLPLSSNYKFSFTTQ